MIQSPIHAFPAALRAVPAQSDARPPAPGGGFEDLVEEDLGGVEAGDDGLSVPGPDGEMEICEPAGDTGGPALVPEQAQIPAGLAAAVPDLADGAEEGEASHVDDATPMRPRTLPGAAPAQTPTMDESATPTPDLPRVEPVASRTGPEEAMRDTGKPAAIPGVQALPPPVPPAPVAVAAPPLPARTAPPTAPVPRQVADAVVRMAGEVTEITLAPAELGKLRITLTRDPQGLVVLLSAERPEALELLRRHMDLLRQELAAQGEEGARLDFTTAGQDGGFAPPGGQAAGPGVAALPGAQADAPARVETVIRPALPGRIDMRI